MRLTELPGRADKEIEFSRFFHSITEGMRLLRQENVAVGAGDNGSINIWIDDDGKYRGEVYRYRSTLDKYTDGTLEGLQGWLKRWFTQIQ